MIQGLVSPFYRGNQRLQEVQHLARRHRSHECWRRDLKLSFLAPKPRLCLLSSTAPLSMSYQSPGSSGWGMTDQKIGCGGESVYGPYIRLMWRKWRGMVKLGPGVFVKDLNLRLDKFTHAGRGNPFCEAWEKPESGEKEGEVQNAGVLESLFATRQGVVAPAWAPASSWLSMAFASVTL